MNSDTTTDFWIYPWIHCIDSPQYTACMADSHLPLLAPLMEAHRVFNRAACGQVLKLCCDQLLSDTRTVFLKLGSRRRILKDGAKTICKGAQERKQVPLYLVSLDQLAKRTGGGWMERLPKIKCRSLNWSVLVDILLKQMSAGYYPSGTMELIQFSKVVKL